MFSDNGTFRPGRIGPLLVIVLAVTICLGALAPTASANQRGTAVNQVNTFVFGCVTSGGDPYLMVGESGMLFAVCAWPGSDRQINCDWDPDNNWERWCGSTGFIRPHTPDQPDLDLLLGGRAADLPPMPKPDHYQTPEDKALRPTAAEGVAANDPGARGGAGSVELLIGPDHGELDLQTNGAFVYRPARNFHGIDGFVYAITDRSGATYYGTVEIEVSARPK